MFNVTILAFLAALLAAPDEAEAVRLLREKGAKIPDPPTRLEAGDCTAWTEADFRLLGELSRLRSASFGPGVTDAALAAIAVLPELDTLQTNESRFTDGGLKALLGLKGLKTLKFFHPGKEFTGAGLAHLAEHPSLERLTVAGSLAFADEGMAAVGKLTRLKEFRTWHAGQTLEGVKHLRSLKSMTSLTLGQRLAYKPPTTVADDVLPVLAELASLETLQLEEARLGLDALLKLRSLPALKKLVLQGIDLPAADLDRLRSELPKAQVQWTAPTEAYRRRIDALFGPR